MNSILFVAAEIAPWKTGGIANVVHKLANALSRTGDISVTVLGTVPSTGGDRPTGYLPGVKFLLVRKPAAPEPLRHIQLQRGYRTAVSRWIQGNPTGIVHFHIFPGARGFLAAAEALKAHAPVVLTCHDWPPYEIPYYQHRVGHRLHWWLSRVLLGRFPDLIVNSRFIETAVRNSFPSATVTVIPNGVCMGEWDASEGSKSSRDEIRLLYWGALWDKKGPDLLLHALARFCHGGRNAYLSVVGSGPVLQKLQKLTFTLGLTGRVEFLGHLDHKTLRMHIDASDAVVFPSAYEGFGIAILEAMACGKPVVTTAFGGPQDFIADGEDGILVRSRTAQSLCDALNDLLARPEFAIRLGRAARQKAQRYDWSRIAYRYYDLYASLAKREPSPTRICASITV